MRGLIKQTQTLELSCPYHLKTNLTQLTKPNKTSTLMAPTVLATGSNTNYLKCCNRL